MPERANEPVSSAPPPGRPEAAAAAWGWQESPAADTRPGEAARARRHGVLQALVAAGVGAAVWLWWSPLAGRIVLAIAALVALSALLAPTSVYAALRRGGAAGGRWTHLCSWPLKSLTSCSSDPKQAFESTHITSNPLMATGTLPRR